MDSVVYKYDVAIDDEFELDLPSGSHVLTVQMQHDKPRMWVRHPIKCGTFAKHRFRLAGTGHTISGSWSYVGSFQMHQGAIVLHLFEAK